jgi:hypothetical protein
MEKSTGQPHLVLISKLFICAQFRDIFRAVLPNPYLVRDDSKGSEKNSKQSTPLIKALTATQQQLVLNYSHFRLLFSLQLCALF